MGQEIKQVKGKIIFKHQTAAEWDESNNGAGAQYVPDVGERVLYDPDENHPYTREKFGDGVHIVKELPFAHGLGQTFGPAEMGNEIFNDYVNNYAGTKAFQITAYSGAHGGMGTYTLDSVAGLEVGMTYTVRLFALQPDEDGNYSNNRFDNCGTITAINGNVVSVEKVYTTNGEINVEVGTTHCSYFRIADRPDLGTVYREGVAHAEGYNNKALGMGSHAEGDSNIANGAWSHVEGKENYANYNSHAEGRNTQSLGETTHSEGGDTIARQSYSHAEGFKSQTDAIAAHAEGENTEAKGRASHAEGQTTHATGNHSHAEGERTTASASNAHAEGYGATASNSGAHAEGGSTVASGSYSHAEGLQGQALGDYSHAEGSGTTANGVGSHAEGVGSKATVERSHAEGYKTTASGAASHAEGDNTEATVWGAHAEGTSTHATAGSAHAEGSGTTASGARSHAEGQNTIAEGSESHTEGTGTHAKGWASHAEGRGTIATGNFQHVEGEYNIEDTANKYIHIAGNGTSSARSNAYTLSKTGEGEFAKSVGIPNFKITENDDGNIALKSDYFDEVVFSRNTAPHAFFQKDVTVTDTLYVGSSVQIRGKYAATEEYVNNKFTDAEFTNSISLPALTIKQISDEVVSFENAGSYQLKLTGIQSEPRAVFAKDVEVGDTLYSSMGSFTNSLTYKGEEVAVKPDLEGYLKNSDTTGLAVLSGKTQSSTNLTGTKSIVVGLTDDYGVVAKGTENIVIGNAAGATADYAMQFGHAWNGEANTVQFGGDAHIINKLDIYQDAAHAVDGVKGRHALATEAYVNNAIANAGGGSGESNDTVFIDILIGTVSWTNLGQQGPNENIDTAWGLSLSEIGITDITQYKGFLWSRTTAGMLSSSGAVTSSYWGQYGLGTSTASEVEISSTHIILKCGTLNPADAYADGDLFITLIK